MVRTREPDLLGSEGTEGQRAGEIRAARKTRRDPQHALHAGGVVDHARPAPDGVEVGGDDHGLLALAGDSGDHVAVATPGDELAPGSEPSVRLVQRH